jgi:hypothetical protein
VLLAEPAPASCRLSTLAAAEVATVKLLMLPGNPSQGGHIFMLQ